MDIIIIFVYSRRGEHVNRADTASLYKFSSSIEVKIHEDTA